MSTETVLETRHLKRYFGSLHAVEDVSLQIRKGEIFGFLGPNGAGKTTTISMILGLTYPSAGEIEVFGQRVTPRQNRILRRVGTMVGGGEASLMLPFSARQHLKCMSYLRPDLPASRIDTVLKRVGLEEAADRPVRAFSTGMKQRLGLGLALLNQPDLLVLDEPTNGMDPSGMHEVRLLLRKLRDEGITIFLSSHLLHEMEQVCDRVAVVRKGRVILESVVSDLLHKQEAVRVRTDDADQVAAILSQIPNSHNVHIQDDCIDIQGISSELVMSVLMQQHIVPKEVSTVRPDLESIFLELTQPSA